MNWTKEVVAELMATQTKAELDEFCDKYGCSYPNASRRKREFKNVKSVERQDLTVDEQVDADKKVARLKEENKRLESLYRRAVKSSNIHEDVLDLAEQYLTRVKAVSVAPPHIGTSKTVEDAILAWADWHGDEVVFKEVMLGLNQYNPQVMCRRVQTSVDNTLSLLFDNHKGTTFETLYVFDLGDAIVGDLLEDNKSTNANGVYQAMCYVSDVKARALTELASHIPVVYISVPGNHGRRTQKMPWKQPTETADWLISKMVELRVKGNDRITCVIPNAWTARVEIRGKVHALNHGYSAAKGGFGGIPFYAFQRSDGKMTALEASQGKFVHYRWYGHIHQGVTLPKMDGIGKQFVVGSLKGGDEYALNELNSYSDPMQKLVGAHDKRGVTWQYDLQVTDNDEVPSRYESAIDDVQ